MDIADFKDLFHSAAMTVSEYACAVNFINSLQRIKSLEEDDNFESIVCDFQGTLHVGHYFSKVHGEVLCLPNLNVVFCMKLSQHP